MSNLQKMTKSCNTCGCELIVPDTWLASSRDTNQYKCRKCKAAYLADWRKKNPGAYKELTYGITEEEYQDMLEAQEHTCAICGTDKPGGRHKKFHIDHNHKTGKVRGLLCWPCNAGLGQFKDSYDNLHSALLYLEHFDNVDDI